MNVRYYFLAQNEEKTSKNMKIPIFQDKKGTFY